MLLYQKQSECKVLGQNTRQENEISIDHSGPSHQIETDVKETDNAENSSSEESLLTKEAPTTNESQNESDIWKNIPTEEEEKTREDEFEEYLADLLL